ncbi:MAG: ssuD [Frondihabitans sp.]|nr:ssuD [Frondihabitans sp.]
MTTPGQFHLNLSLLTPGHFRTAWRLPHADPRAQYDVEHFKRLARIAEEALVHAVFLGDSPALSGAIESAPETGLDPAILLSHVAAVTERLGFIVTSSSTYEHPYSLARRFLAFDHVTHGRAAVNIVTTFAPNAAANYGLPQTPPKDERYRRADEFLDVVTALWESWEPDALVADQATGEFADPNRIHTIDHRGEYFSVRGPLSVPASPQGRPVIVQAGGSPGGLGIAAKYADVVFTVAQTKQGAVDFRAETRERVLAAGRPDGSVVISLGVVVLIGLDEADVARREEELRGTVDVARSSAGFVSGLGLDPKVFTADVPIRLEDLPEQPIEQSSAGFQGSTRALLAAGPLTARELVYRSAGGGGHRLLTGTPETIADDLESWFRAGAADGFTVMAADTTVDFERFATLVVPELQRRGLFRTESEGTTLREGLGLPNPVTSVASVRSSSDLEERAVRV